MGIVVLFTVPQTMLALSDPGIGVCEHFNEKLRSSDRLPLCK